MRKRLAVVLPLLVFALPSFAAITGVVMSTDGQAISGARVSIYAPEQGDARRARLLSASPDAVPIATVQTEAKGTFSFESPKDAVVDLRVFARGYEPFGRRIEKDEEVGAIALPKTEMKQGWVRANGKPVANAVVAIGYGAEYITKTD